MTINQNRVQPGSPAGGQFARTDRAESDVALAAPATPASYARSADRPDADSRTPRTDRPDGEPRRNRDAVGNRDGRNPQVAP